MVCIYASSYRRIPKIIFKFLLSSYKIFWQIPKVLIYNSNHDCFVNIIMYISSTDVVHILEEFRGLFSQSPLLLCALSAARCMRLVMHLAFGMNKVVQTEISMSLFILTTFGQVQKIILRRKLIMRLIHWEVLMIMVASCIILLKLLLYMVQSPFLQKYQICHLDMLLNLALWILARPTYSTKANVVS